MQINRKTDSFFDWLGDWGGLQDGLTLLVEIIVQAYQVYALKIKLAATFIRFRPAHVSNQSARNDSDSKKAAYTEQFVDSPDDPQRKNIVMNIIKNFNLIERIKPSSFFARFWEQCR